MKTSRRTFLAGASAAAVVATPYIASAQKKYDDGASDSEIKNGHTNPYSGPASSYGVIGKTETAFFTMINEKGGINGRKIVPVYKTICPVPVNLTLAACTSFTEDDHVFAVIGSMYDPAGDAPPHC